MPLFGTKNCLLLVSGFFVYACDFLQKTQSYLLKEFPKNKDCLITWFASTNAEFFFSCTFYLIVLWLTKIIPFRWVLRGLSPGTKSRISIELNSSNLKFERSAWMVWLLLTQIKLLDCSRSSTMWFGVSGNTVLNTRWTQFRNQANYRIIDSNVRDCANVTEIPASPSAKRYFPPLTSMRCTCIASNRKSLLISRQLLHCGSLTKTSSSIPLKAITQLSSLIHCSQSCM